MLSGGLVLRGMPATNKNNLDINDNWFLTTIIFTFMGTHILKDWK